MPLKFKLYYACLVFLVLWVITMSYLFVYALVAPGFTVESPAITIPLITLILLTIAILAFVGFRFVKHLKNQTLYSKTELKVFSLASKIGIFFSAVSFLIFISQFSKIFTIQYAGLINISLYGGLLLATICTLFICIVGRLILRAIDTQHETIIENIGNL